MTHITTLFEDTETFSATSITDGTYAYAADAEVTLFAYAFNNDPVKVIDLTAGESIPNYVVEAQSDPDVLKVIHNSMFDRTVMRLALGIVIPIDQIHDTMVCALTHSLPGGLATLCEVLGVDATEVKDPRGGELIQLFCKPRPKNSKIRRATRETHPKEWEEFKSYAQSDIRAMRAVFNKSPTWNYRDRELELWRLDARTNDLGVTVDRELARCAIEAVTEAQAGLAGSVSELTFGAVERATQRDRLLKFILEYHGVSLPDMSKSTLERRLNDPDLPREVRELIAIRLEASRSSTSKYKALLKAVSDDGTLKGTLQFCGASRTGRWAGRTFQPQNLFRPTLKQHQIDEGIDLIKKYPKHLDLIVPNVMEVAANAVRGCIVAPPTKKLVVSDLSNIEGRFAAWIAGEQWKIKAFADYDAGTGHDLYKLAYARSFNMAPEDVTKDNRQIGKVLELACFGADTQVLTHNGVKAIVDLTTEDKLWDGVEWVKHEGTVARGAKKVVNVAGILVTPDHLILTNRTWRRAEQLASSESTLSQALATSLARTPWSVLIMELRGVFSQFGYNVRAALPSILSSRIISEKGQATLAENVPPRRAASGVKNIMGMPTSYRTKTIDRGYCAAYPPASTGVGTRKMQDTPTTAVGEYECIPNGLQIVKLSYDILSLLMVGTARISNWIVLTLTKVMSQAIFVLSQKRRTKATGGKSSPCNNESISLSNVYDVVNAGPRHRFTILTNKGPLLVHNCGYGGGVGAYITMVAAYRLDLDEMTRSALPTIPVDVREEALAFWEWTVKKNRSTFGLDRDTFVACDALKRLYRLANPEIAAVWGELENAFVSAMNNKGTDFPVREHLTFRRDGAWLKVRLPSGRLLCYPDPKMDAKGQLTYAGVNPYSRKWSRIKTYSGKLFENICQAGSRDVMAHNMPIIEAAGYEGVLTVHDELITQAPDTEDYNDKVLSKLLAANPPWAPTLPLSAGGFTAYRYKKE